VKLLDLPPRLRGLGKNISLMSKCLISVAVTLLVGTATYIAIQEFGLENYLSKIHIALIPSIALGLLTCIFIWINRKYWNEVISEATFVHFVTWTVIVFLFIITSGMLRLLVYFLGFLYPTAWISLLKYREKPDLLYSLFLGLHGGIGAYCMVVILNWILSVAGIPLPASPSSFINMLTARPRIDLLLLLPKSYILHYGQAFVHLFSRVTILPIWELATLVQPIFLVVIYACFIEEVMFRLPLALFKKFGMYPMAFLISFLFIYLHALTRLSLDPATLVQVLSCIAFANAIFIAVYTRTMCIWCSVVAHMVYNLLVLSQTPPIVALGILMLNGVLHILLVKLGLMHGGYRKIPENVTSIH